MFLDDYKSIFANSNENNPEILFSLKHAANGNQTGKYVQYSFWKQNPRTADRKHEWFMGNCILDLAGSLLILIH